MRTNIIKFGAPKLNAAEFDPKNLAAAKLDAGMITMVDPANIPEGALQLAKNATVRFDRTSRRPGSVPFGPTPPDSDSVLKLASFKTEVGDGYTFRFTKSSVCSLDAGPVWTPLTGTLTGSATDRIQTAIVIDSPSGVKSQLVFSNNGADPIQLVDLGTVSFDDLSDFVHPVAVPKYRYVAGFYNRVVGAANAGVNEVEIGWSGDADPTEWDPAINETAGNAPLIESTSDLSDFITGIFAFTNVMVVLREKSIWLATKQAIPTQPFYFSSVIPGIGCDCPYSVMNVGNGLAWVDRRTKSVYLYTPGGQLESIGQAIEKNILNNVDDPLSVFAGYNPIPQEYTIYIPSVGSKLVSAWTYNFRNKAWAYNEFYDISCVNDTDLATSGTTIDELLGTIDGLIGTIDDLSPSNMIMSTRLYGRNDGSLAQEDINTAVDAAHTDYPDGIPYTTELISKTFEAETEDIDLLIALISVEYVAQQGGTFSLYYSRDGGYTEDSWVLAKQFIPKIIGRPKLLQYKKVIRCRRFAWKLVFTNGLFDVLAYNVQAYPSGPSSNRPQL